MDLVPLVIKILVIFINKMIFFPKYVSKILIVIALLVVLVTLYIVIVPINWNQVTKDDYTYNGKKVTKEEYYRLLPVSHRNI